MLLGCSDSIVAGFLSFFAPSHPSFPRSSKAPTLPGFPSLSQEFDGDDDEDFVAEQFDDIVRDSKIVIDANAMPWEELQKTALELAKQQKDKFDRTPNAKRKSTCEDALLASTSNRKKRRRVNMIESDSDEERCRRCASCPKVLVCF